MGTQREVEKGHVFDKSGDSLIPCLGRYGKYFFLKRLKRSYPINENRVA